MSDQSSPGAGESPAATAAVGPASKEVGPPVRLHRLVRRDDFFLGDPEDLVHFDWSPYLDASKD